MHTRSAKYGRLSRGQLVCVPPVLIKRLKQHFSTLAAHHVDVVLGCNGWVWVQARHLRARCSRAALKPAAPPVARRRLGHSSQTQAVLPSTPTQMLPPLPPPLPLRDLKMRQTHGMPKLKPALFVRACARHGSPATKSDSFRRSQRRRRASAFAGLQLQCVCWLSCSWRSIQPRL